MVEILVTSFVFGIVGLLLGRYVWTGYMVVPADEKQAEIDKLKAEVQALKAAH